MKKLLTLLTLAMLAACGAGSNPPDEQPQPVPPTYTTGTPTTSG